MAIVKLTFAQWPKYLQAMAKRSKQAIDRGIQSGAKQCIQVLQKRADNAVPASANGSPGARNTGYYRSKWRVRAVKNGVSIYNEAPYADVIEKGRRAGKRQPPTKAIEKWAQRKLGLSAKEARMAAYPIARAIGRRGLRPRRVLSGAVDDLKRIVLKEIRRELMEEMRR